MNQKELIKEAQKHGWEKLEAVSGGVPFTILKKGEYELWFEGDCCNILKAEGIGHIGMGLMYLSKAKPNPDPWVIGLFGPIVGRWFSLKDNVFLDN